MKNFICPFCSHELPYPEDILDNCLDDYIRCDLCGTKIYSDGSVEHNDECDGHEYYNDKDYFDLYDR